MKINQLINESQMTCSECGGPAFSDLILAEKKDACYHKVKASAKVWPSAYASGRLVQCRKKGAANYGNKSEGVAEGSLEEDKGMTGYNAFKREWRTKHGADAKVPAYDSKEYTSYVYRQNDKKQGVAEDFNPEYDDEAGMADNNLETLARAVEGIDDVISAGDNLPEWCQEKIAVAKSMLVAVWDYMKSEENIEQGVSEGICSIQEANAIFDDFERSVAARGLTEDIFDSITDEQIIAETAAWRRKEGKSKKGGLNAKGVASYRRENPGSKLQTAVTTKPSKLKPGSKAAKRRKSFCARMGGVKGPMKKPNGKPTRKALALRKWNC